MRFDWDANGIIDYDDGENEYMEEYDELSDKLNELWVRCQIAEYINEDWSNKLFMIRNLFEKIDNPSTLVEQIKEIIDEDKERRFYLNNNANVIFDKDNPDEEYSMLTVEEAFELVDLLNDLNKKLGD